MNATCSEGTAAPDPFSWNVRTPTAPAAHAAASTYANITLLVTLERDDSGVATHDRVDGSIDCAVLRQYRPIAGSVTATTFCVRAATSTGLTFSDTSPG